MSWVKNLNDRRQAMELALKPPRAKDEPAVDKAQVKKDAAALDVSELEGAMVSSKVLAEHGALLKPCAADMTALAEMAQEMEAWRANQFGRAVERFYGALGKQLTATPAKDRAELAAASIKAMRALAEQVGGGELLAPAISAMTDLVSWTARKEQGKEKTLADSVATAAAIRDRVGALITNLEGRAGVGTALNVFSSLIYIAEKITPNLALKDRFALWEKIAVFMADASPRTRVDQVGVAKLAQLLSEAAPNAKGDAARALELAKTAVWREFAGAREAAAAQIKVEPQGLDKAGAPREVFDALTKALDRVVAQNPAGPPNIIDRALALKAKVAELVPGATEDQVASYRDIARILTSVAATPVAEPVMQYLGDHLAAIVVSEGARQVLADTAARADVAAIAVGLVRTHAAVYGADVAQLERGLESIAKLPPSIAMRPALALLPRLQDAGVAGPLASALAAFVRHSGASSLDNLGSFADRFSAVYPGLKNVIGDQAGAVAGAIAGTASAEPLAPEVANVMPELAATVQNIVGDLPLSKLILPDRDNRPGLFALTDLKAFRFDPKPLLYALLPSVARAAGANEGQKLELVRRTIQLASELAKLDRDPHALLARVQQDLDTAIVDPEKLHFGLKAGDAVNLRAKGAPRRGKDVELRALQFLSDHPSFPIELAFTAGVNLSPDQNTWLHDQLTQSKSRVHSRALRDAVLGAIEVGRADLIEALRTSQSTPKAIAAAVVFLAQEYRAGRMNQVPFDRIVQSLGEKKDPVQEIESERAQQALAALNLQGMNGLKADPEGLATLNKLSQEVRSLVGYIPEPYKGAVVDMLKKIADGTWSKARYESDVAKRQLEGLTPKQIAVWMQPMVTPAEKAAAAPDDPELLDAMVVLKGLVGAMPKEVKLGGPNLPELKWDEASVVLLRGMRDQLLGELHEKQKGSPEHRELSSKLRPINHNLAAIELHVALSKAFRGAAADPQTTLLELKPLIDAAVTGVRKLGGKGCTGALLQVAGVTPEVTTSPRQGVHAADDDWIGAWLTSYNGGSCVNPINGQNRYALAEFMTTPQYRMCRVCDGEKGTTRGQLRLFQADIDGVRRHVIWADVPYGVDNCTYAPMDQQKLFYKHALAKAQAMGVPLIFHYESPYAQYGAAYAAYQIHGAASAQEAGLDVRRENVTMYIDYGLTGAHQSEAVLGGEYFVNIQPGQKYAANAQAAGIVMPR